MKHSFCLRSVLPPLLVFLLTFALFAPSIGYPLADYDDMAFIARNNLVLYGLSFPTLRAAFTTLHGDASMYSPLLWVSFMADVSLFHATAASPWPFHFTNVLLHSFSACLLYFLLRRCRATALSAALLALLWALHPLRVESVAWVTERKDTLSTVFAFLSALAYLRAFDPDRPTSRPCLFFALSTLALLLGLLVKPMLVTLPFLFLLFDVFPLRRIPLDRSFTLSTLRRPILEKLPLFVLSAAASILSLVTQADAIHHGTSLLSRLLLVPLHYAFYLIKTFIPIRLTPYYHPIVFTLSGFVPFVLLFVLILSSAWRRRLSQPAWGLGWLAFFGLLVPVVGFIQLGIHNIADRYTYLPAIGLSIAAIPLFSATSRPLRLATHLLSALAILALCPLTLKTLRTWASVDAFYDHAATIFPNHPAVSAHATRKLLDRGDFDAAEALADKTLDLYPADAQMPILKALCLDERLGPQAALDYMLTHFQSNFMYPTQAREIAQYALRATNFPAARAHAEFAIKSIPPSDSLVSELRDMLARIDYLESPSPRVSPTEFFIYYVSQWALLHRRDAWDYFQSVLPLAWDSPPNLNNLAWILATSPGWNPVPPADTLAIAQRAASLAPTHPVILDTLAAAYANASDFPAAIATATNALALAASDPDSALPAKIQSHLDCYLQSRPYRSP